MRDFIPEIGPEDVDRILARDFEPEDAERIRKALDPIASDRVRLAVLKLARGDANALDRFVEAARLDPRDVLAAAEYPSQLALGFSGMAKLGEEGLRALRLRDKSDYEAWLKGSPAEPGRVPEPSPETGRGEALPPRS